MPVCAIIPRQLQNGISCLCTHMYRWIHRLRCMCVGIHEDVRVCVSLPAFLLLSIPPSLPLFLLCPFHPVFPVGFLPYSQAQYLSRYTLLSPPTHSRPSLRFSFSPDVCACHIYVQGWTRWKRMYNVRQQRPSCVTLLLLFLFYVLECIR